MSTCYCCHAYMRSSERERAMAGQDCEVLHRHVSRECEKHAVPYLAPEACPFAIPHTKATP